MITSRHFDNHVIPAKAGIQKHHHAVSVDSRFRGSDDER
jgi:hypothetical protein